ncbi:MAG: DNA repair protein RecO [Bacilli bacterium]|nr:DNA repair protein RecO [Bacilli bacterium]MDD3895570.1 DNA repair protein RecO [Bacilli bacterium]MDD4407772.1 DNA repair protein RecO [Bacilli bacterium]
MLKEVEGIIISETNYGETSKIINILTKNGIVGVMAKGSKSLKSPLRSYTQKFTYGKFYLYYKENKLSILKSVDIINDLVNIKTNIELIGYMSYISDLTYQIMKQNNNEDLYNIYINAILKINDGLNAKIICNIVELKILDYLGVGINFNTCIKCGNTKNIVTINPDEGGYICKNCYTNEKIFDEKTIKMLRMYYLVDISSISDLKISDEVINNINNFINIYYERYTGLYLKSKKFLDTITT